MTRRELADRIKQDQCVHNVHERCIVCLEFLLATALEDAYEEGARHQFAGDKESYEARIKQARDLAYEDAARIAGECGDHAGECVYSDCHVGMAKAIRQQAQGLISSETYQDAPCQWIADKGTQG